MLYLSERCQNADFLKWTWSAPAKTAGQTRELNALARDGPIERRHGALVIANVARLAQLVETILEE